MTDIKSKEERRKNMAAIRSKDTKPEMYIRSMLHRKGYRFRVHSNKVPGHPDLFLKKYNTAIFVHGCYWHRHQGCKYAYTPKSRVDFWKAKFDQNIRRDKEIRAILEQERTKCLVIWECTIKRMSKNKNKERCVLDKIEVFLNSEDLYSEF